MGLPLYRCAALRAIEAQAAADLPAGTLMQRAGTAAARWIDADAAPAARIAVVCGPGNNGGDGYACATALRAAGRDVVCVAPLPAATADARAAAAGWQQAGGRTIGTSTFDEGTLVVDAMFGIGLARPLAAPYLPLVQAIEAAAAPVVALDLPSGLDADTGAWIGATPGLRARTTLSFLGAKPGLHTGDGVDACGEVIVDALGVALPPSPLQLVAPEDFAALAQPRRRNSHKGSFGELQVVGGARGMTGAVLLAARAGLQLGAGRVYVDALDGGLALDPLQPELMFRPAPASAVTVIGCGLGHGDAARARLQAALQNEAPCVIDADALNLLAADAALFSQLRGSPGPRILTPHPLEAARLLGSTAAAVQADRLGAAQALAGRSGAWVLLKGAGSVIADGGRCWINPTGTPALATAGSGDVLAGMVGALLAQGFDAQCALLGAVWLHGRAADDYGSDVGLVAGAIAPRAAAALARLRAPR